MKPDFSPLTPRQIKWLNVLAGTGWLRHGFTGAGASAAKEQWRHEQQLKACGESSLKACNQSHFRRLLAHWFVLIGRSGEAFDLLMRTGPGFEDVEQELHLIAEQAAVIASCFMRKGQPGDNAITGAWNYVRSIASDKFKGRKLDTLSVEELQQLLFTVTNRANAMRGVGSTWNRNKWQRRKPAPVAEPVGAQIDQPF